MQPSAIKYLRIILVSLSLLCFGNAPGQIPAESRALQQPDSMTSNHTAHAGVQFMEAPEKLRQFKEEAEKEKKAEDRRKWVRIAAGLVVLTIVAVALWKRRRRLS